MEFRTFEQGTGWGMWREVEVEPEGEFSNLVATRLWERLRPGETFDVGHGFSLTQTNDDGAPVGVGVCMVEHPGGVTLVEYR